MAKSTGLAMATLNLDDASGTPRDVRNDIGNFDFETPYDSQEVTGVDVSAYERNALIVDWKGSLNGFFNPAANKLHSVMSGDLRVARTLSMVIAGATIAGEVLLESYKVSRSNKGELTTQIPFSLQSGIAAAWS